MKAKSQYQQGGFTTFIWEDDKERYNKFCLRNIIPCKCLDFSVLDELNIHADLDGIIAQMGWENFFHVSTPTFVELTREFYTTFQFNENEDFDLFTEGIVEFRLMGTEFTLSIAKFNVALGLIPKDDLHHELFLNASCEFYDDFQKNIRNYGMNGLSTMLIIILTIPKVHF